MKIFINTANQPPTCSAGFSARTDAEGALRVYSSSLGSSVSALAFKRGTTVPLDVFFPADAADEAAEIAKFRFGLKRRGKYDEILVLLCEADGPGEPQDDGTVKFSVRPTFSASAIDAELCVNDVSADDLASAAFVAEFEWENAAGEISATADISAVICNNVVRAGAGGASGMLSHPFAALMVIRMSWAEYCALSEEDFIADALYVVPDAPNEVEEHNADANAHPALLSAAYEDAQNRAAELIDEAEDRMLAAMDAKIAAAEERFSSGNQASQDAAAEAQNQLTQILANYSTQTAETVANAVAPVSAALADEAQARRDADAALRFGAAASVLHGEIHADETGIGNGTMLAALVSFESLGVPAGTDLVPKSITFYRRSTTTSDNHDTPLFLRVLRKNAAGTAWETAYQSANAVTASAQNQINQPLPSWNLENVDGRGAIPAAEQVLLIQVSAANAANSAMLHFGAACCPSIPGALGSANYTAAQILNASATLSPSSFSPAADVAYFDAANDLRARLAALEQRMTDDDAQPQQPDS